MGNWRLNVDLSRRSPEELEVPLQNKTLHFQKKLIIYQLAMSFLVYLLFTIFVQFGALWI